MEGSELKSVGSECLGIFFLGAEALEPGIEGGGARGGWGGSEKAHATEKKKSVAS